MPADQRAPRHPPRMPRTKPLMIVRTTGWRELRAPARVAPRELRAPVRLALREFRGGVREPPRKPAEREPERREGAERFLAGWDRVRVANVASRGLDGLTVNYSNSS
jgi:hypothetical protein